MKHSFLSLALVCSTISFAQVTITSADMPNAGDSVLVSMAADVGPNDLETSDSNYVWDYSMLVPTLQRYEKFDSPFGFTTPFNLIFNPFNTSYGNENNLITAGGGIPGLTFDEAYDFLKESSSQFKQIGVGYRVNGIPLPFLYSDNDVIYRFPMNFGDADTDDYKFGLPIPSIGYYGQTGHRETIVDGWGSLTTPYGTFNTIRVKATIAATDTLYLDSLGFGFAFPRPLRYEYKWIANGKQIPVLKVDANDVFGLPVISQVEYIDSIIPGVPMLGIVSAKKNDFTSVVYPNPASDATVLRYVLSSASPVKITLGDLMGRKISVVTDQRQQAGTHEEMIALTGIAPGLYTLCLETNEGKAVQRLVVTK
ncbi:MAG: T9SS type A sorting domain-containing protein [Bacteroidia bacterium]